MQRKRRMLRRAAATTLLTFAMAGFAFSQLSGTVRPAGAASADAAAAAMPLPQLGVQFHATWSDYTPAQRTAVLDKLAAAHVQWVRVDIGWASIEDTGPGARNPYHVGILDSVVQQANARGIKVLGMLWLTPDWANGGAGPRVGPTNPADYANFARWMAARYQGRIQAWEVWNEPNLPEFWVGTDAARYAGLVKAAYPAFKAGDPGALVVAGAVSQNDVVWLQQMYDAGAGGSFDVLSTHPYQAPSDAPPELPDDGHMWTLAHLAAVHQLMVSRGDGGKPIWATEFGWSSHPNTGGEANWNKGVSLAAQADYAVRTFRYLATNFPYVTNAFWYNERDRVDGDAQLDNYGILNRDLSEKPVYQSLKAMMESPGVVAQVAPTAPVLVSGPAVAPPAPSSTPVPSAPAIGGDVPALPSGGYMMFDRAGGTYAFGAPDDLGSAGGHGVVAGAVYDHGRGAWVVTAAGDVRRTGAAPSFGSLAGVPLSQPIVGMAATPSGNGYWLVARDGGIFAFGDAAFHGSTGDMRLNQPIVGMASTASGQGYWLVAADGGLFAFGDAAFHGSTGDIRLNQPVVGMAGTASGQGYWLVARDGGIFAFGDAAFQGSTGNIRLNQPIVGMVRSPSGHGYRFVAADGGVFSFGDAPFLGSAVGRASAPVVSLAVAA